MLPTEKSDANGTAGAPSGELPAPRLRALIRRAPGAASAPADDGSTICTDVLAAAHQEAGHLTINSEAPSPEGMLRMKTMLGVICYCYVKGVFDSEEIEHRLWSDPAFLATFGNNPPTAMRIRGFRRLHRQVILTTIEHALMAFKERRHEPYGPPASSSRKAVAPETEHMQAEHLLDMANIMDQLSSDS